MHDLRETIRHRMADFLQQPCECLDDSAKLSDLVTSSFLMVEMIIDLQEEFERRFGQQEMLGVETVGQLLDLFCARGESRPADAAAVAGSCDI